MYIFHFLWLLSLTYFLFPFIFLSCACKMAIFLFDSFYLFNLNNLSGKKDYQQWLNHCTVRRQHFFMIKKCGKASCNLCRPIRGPHDVFNVSISFQIFVGFFNCIPLDLY